MIKQMVNIVLAFLISPFYKAKKKIILIGGHEGKLYADNGKVFNEFMKNNEEYDTYWIMNKDAADFNDLTNVVPRGSIKNYLYYFKSYGVFFSHSASDVAPILHRVSFFKQPFKTMLEHGVTGLKVAQGNNPDEENPRLTAQADMVVAVSEFEKNIKVEKWNVPEREVKITGMPRYDKLVKQDHYRDEIIFMPTWREWLEDCPAEEFKDTYFFKDIMSLVNDKRLLELLRENNFKLMIYIHFYFHKYFDEFEIDGDFIEIIPNNTDIQDYLVNSSIMITDYSSVSWDFFYLDKPVVFYQSDLEKYLDYRGSYINLENDLFGMSAYNSNELITVLKKVFNDREGYVNKFEKHKKLYFKYFDNNNCSRVLTTFENLKNKR